MAEEIRLVTVASLAEVEAVDIDAQESRADIPPGPPIMPAPTGS